MTKPKPTLAADRVRNELSRMRLSTEFFIKIDGNNVPITGYAIEPVGHSSSPGARNFVFLTGETITVADPEPEPAPVVEMPAEAVIEAAQENPVFEAEDFSKAAKKKGK